MCKYTITFESNTHASRQIMLYHTDKAKHWQINWESYQHH